MYKTVFVPRSDKRVGSAVDPAVSDESYQVALEAEKEAGEEYEIAIASWKRFLDQNPQAPEKAREQARRKIDVDLPAKLEERDYHRTLKEAEASGFDPDVARPLLESYLKRYPNGKHAQEVKQLLEEGLKKRSDDLAFAAALKAAQEAADTPETGLVAFQEYLKSYPQGLHKADAEAQIARLSDEIENRAYRKLLDEVKAAGTNLQSIIPACKQFLSQYPKGKRAQEVAKLLAALPPWQIQVGSTRLLKQYREGAGGKEIILNPRLGTMMVAKVDVTFETISPLEGTWRERLEPGSKVLSKEAMEFMLGDGKMSAQLTAQAKTDKELLAKPARLFLSNQVLLIFPDKTFVAPELTSEPLGPGWTRFKTANWVAAADTKDPAVIRFVRFAGNTAALVQPERKVNLSLLYSVPATTTKATLRFHNASPIEVTFTK
jgi:hypothetical protein